MVVGADIPRHDDAPGDINALRVCRGSSNPAVCNRKGRRLDPAAGEIDQKAAIEEPVHRHCDCFAMLAMTQARGVARLGLTAFGLAARAAGVSFIGRRLRHVPSNACAAAATAEAVGTSPISPTPFAP